MHKLAPDGNIIRIRVFERQFRQCSIERGEKKEKRKKTACASEEAMQNHLKECNFTSVPDASNKI